MRIGAPHYLLFSRYADLWHNLLTGVDAEWLEVDAIELQAALTPHNFSKVEAVAGVNFQLAVLELHHFHDVDALLLPHLNPQQDSAKGSGQNPWIASFGDMVQLQFPRLPKLLQAPAQQALPRDYLEPVVLKQLMNVVSNAALVRRSWQRQSLQATKKVQRDDIIWRVVDKKTVALIGQPWLFEDSPVDLAELVASHYPAERYHVIQQHQFVPAHLRKEGWALESNLLATDAEVLGAARWLARKQEVEELVFISDSTQPTDAWLARKIEALGARKYSSYSLQELTKTEGLATLRYIVDKHVPVSGQIETLHVDDQHTVENQEPVESEC